MKEGDEKLDMMNQALRYLESTSVNKWVLSFLKDLKIAYKPGAINYYLGASMGEFNPKLIYLKTNLMKLNI